MRKKTKLEITTRSVYSDLGFEDHEEMSTKADLVIEIHKAIKTKKITQTKAAEILGITQPKLSELLSGHFRGYSVERLMHFLNELGKDVDIVIRPKTGRHRASVNVYHSNRERSFRTSMTAKGKI